MHRSRRRGNGAHHRSPAPRQVLRRKLQLIRQQRRKSRQHLLHAALQCRIAAELPAGTPGAHPQAHLIPSAHVGALRPTLHLHIAAVAARRAVGIAPAYRRPGHGGATVLIYRHRPRLHRDTAPSAVLHHGRSRHLAAHRHCPGRHTVQTAAAYTAAADAAPVDGGSIGPLRRHLPPQPGHPLNKYAPLLQHGIVVHRCHRQRRRGPHRIRHIDPALRDTASHGGVPVVGGHRQTHGPRHRLRQLPGQLQRRSPRQLPLRRLLHHRAAGTAQRIRHPMGVPLLLCTNGQHTRLPQRQFRRPQHRGPQDTGQRYRRRHRQAGRGPAGFHIRHPLTAQLHRAVSVRPMAHRHRPLSQQIPSRRRVLIRLIDLLSLQNVVRRILFQVI